MITSPVLPTNVLPHQLPSVSYEMDAPEVPPGSPGLPRADAYSGEAIIPQKSPDVLNVNSDDVQNSPMYDDSDVEFIPSSQAYVCPFKYNPVDNAWQVRICSDLGLRYVKTNGLTPGGPSDPLTTPSGIIPVLGDGNCFFRTMSVTQCQTHIWCLDISQVICRVIWHVSQWLGVWPCAGPLFPL